MPPATTTALSPVDETPWRRQVAWLLVTLAYLFAFPYTARLNDSNENARVWATRAIVEHGVLNLDEVQREWGDVDGNARNERHAYSGKAPGASFLGVPVLAVYTKLRHLIGWTSPDQRETTFWLRLLALKLPLGVFFWFFARYVERITGSPAARDLLVVGLGLGTLMYPYGQSFTGHALAAAAAFGSFMLLAPPGGRGRTKADRPGAFDRPLLASGFLAGWTVMFEYQAAFVVAALAVYALYVYRERAAAFFTGALPVALSLGLYHTALFGRPWRFPFGNLAHAELPRWEALGGLLLRPDYGMFAFSPFLALGLLAAVWLVAAVRGRGPRREGTLILSSAVMMLLFAASRPGWRAEWAVGPSSLTVLAPFLAFGIARAWPLVLGRPWLSAVVAGLVLSSVLLNVASGAAYPHYPAVFDNPVFDVTFRLLGEGYAPYGLGWLLGLRGLASLAPLALVVLGAVALGAGGDDPRPARWLAHVGLALLVAVAFLAPLSGYGRKLTAAEASALAFVRSTWDPPPGAAPAR